MGKMGRLAYLSSSIIRKIDYFVFMYIGFAQGAWKTKYSKFMYSHCMDV
jgi:hypothetical protein